MPCLSYEQAEDKYNPPIIRVAVIRGKASLSLSVTRPFKILALNNQQCLYEGGRTRNVSVKAIQEGIRFGDKDFMIYGIKVVPSKDASIAINGRKFRGNIDIIRAKDKTLLVVNHINVEDYIRGVLYHEVSHWWPKEALRAQAITARTFALYQAEVNKDKDYDVTSDIYSQVYGGATSEKFRATRAVRRTEAQVLKYNGEIFPTYYHATCGGRTEDASVLWNTDLPVLKGVLCNFCQRSPHYKWQVDIPINKIEKALRKKGFSVGKIKYIRLQGLNKSGRILKLRIGTEEGVTLISTKEFRQILGPNVIRSRRFICRVNDGLAYFKGIGWGHGVGMCQWGTYFMARKGYAAEQILKRYYPGAEIEAF